MLLSLLSRYVGFNSKFDETVVVGEGRLRPLKVGPPTKKDADIFIVNRVLDVSSLLIAHPGQTLVKG